LACKPSSGLQHVGEISVSTKSSYKDAFFSYILL